jgi:hypothetical protein
MVIKDRRESHPFHVEACGTTVQHDKLITTLEGYQLDFKLFDADPDAAKVRYLGRELILELYEDDPEMFWCLSYCFRVKDDAKTFIAIASDIGMQASKRERIRAKL